MQAMSTAVLPSRLVDLHFLVVLKEFVRDQAQPAELGSITEG